LTHSTASMGNKLCSQNFSWQNTCERKREISVGVGAWH